MPILSGDEDFECRPDSCPDFVLWWLREFSIATGAVCAGLMLWGPLAVIAVPALLRPGLHLVYLARTERQQVQADRARIVAAELAERQHIGPAEPIVATAERIEQARPQLGEAQQ